MYDKTKLEHAVVAACYEAATFAGMGGLQRAGGGRVVPESFTHGTSAQRQRWFDTGLKNGSVKRCDTFSAAQL